MANRRGQVSDCSRGPEAANDGRDAARGRLEAESVQVCAHLVHDRARAEYGNEGRREGFTGSLGSHARRRALHDSSPGKRREEALDLDQLQFQGAMPEIFKH